MNGFTIARIGLVVFFVAILQVSAVSSITVFGGTPDLVLVTLVSLALLRGSIVGAVAGFAAGLVIDVATLGTLGVTSLLLTIAGYWAGRYGETTGRGRPQAPIIAVAAITVLVALGGYGLHYMLGDAGSARVALAPVLPALLLNLLLTYPVYRLLRKLIGTEERVERAREVELLV